MSLSTTLIAAAVITGLMGITGLISLSSSRTKEGNWTWGIISVACVIITGALIALSFVL